MADLTQLVRGVDFGEGPRWHDGRLWYSDFYHRKVYAVSLDGSQEVILEIDDRPSGLGWMPDGSLLVVSMERQQVLRVLDGQTSVHADLSGVLTGRCNDMVVDADGRAYVGSFGFDLEAGDDMAPSRLAMVAADGTVSVAAEDLLFPNGAVITDDGSTLIVGETFGGRYTAFTTEADTGALLDRRVWAAVEGSAPDGCVLDRNGGIWFSDATTPRVQRVVEGGEITDVIDTPQQTYACTLGGADGRTLFILTAAGSHPDQVAGRGEGGVWTTTVSHPKAGRP